MVLRRSLPGKLRAAHRQRSLRPPVPIAIRQTARQRPFVLNGERAVGLLQLGIGLRSAGLAWPFQYPLLVAAGYGLCRRANHFHHACSPLRPIPWRPFVRRIAELTAPISLCASPPSSAHSQRPFFSWPHRLPSRQMATASFTPTRTILRPSRRGSYTKTDIF